MTVNEKSNVVIQPYNRSNVPQLDVDLRKYIQDELQRLEASLRSLNVAGIEVLNEPPLSPVRGMVKYNVSPWDALGNGSEGLVVYNGTSWAAV
jgi:hypothetical protein